MRKITNRRIVAKEGPDFYPTPEWATIALLDNEKFKGKIWEPACGDGAISNVLIKNGFKIESSDLYQRGYGKSNIDFLKTNIKIDNIITNPPFNIAEAFLHHGLKCCRKKYALLLRLAFVESVTRYVNVYSVNPPTRIWVFSQRLSMYPAGSVVKGGGTTSYAWFIWDKENKTKQTIIKWIKPGYKSYKSIIIKNKKFVLYLAGRKKKNAVAS